MPRPLTLAGPLAQRPRPRAVSTPVTPSERDTCIALELQGVPQDLILRVVLPMARATKIDCAFPAGVR